MAPSFWWGAADLGRATRNGWKPTMIVQLLSLNKMMDIGRKHQGEKIKMVCEALKKRNHILSNKHLEKTEHNSLRLNTRCFPRGP